MENEVDKFLEGLNNEPQDNPFEQKVEDPFTQDPKEEDKKEEPEEKLPFNKDPKIQRFIDKQVAKALESHKPTEIERFVEETHTDDDALVDVLTRVIGNDTPEKVSAIKDFKKALDGRDERVRKEALKEIDNRVDEERQAELEAQRQLTRGFEDIEETFNVDLTSNTTQSKATRSEFVDFITRISPKDDDGNVIEFPDLPETFKLFQDLKKSQAQPSRAKELASRSMTRSSGGVIENKPTDNSWNAVERLFSKLKD